MLIFQLTASFCWCSVIQRVSWVALYSVWQPVETLAQDQQVLANFATVFKIGAFTCSLSMIGGVSVHIDSITLQPLHGMRDKLLGLLS